VISSVYKDYIFLFHAVSVYQFMRVWQLLCDFSVIIVVQFQATVWLCVYTDTDINVSLIASTSASSSIGCSYC
jgi:hypothetical protein